MSALTKEGLLGLTALPRERLDLPEVGPGEHVWVSGMSGRERDAFEASLSKGPKGQRRNVENFRARLAALCLVDEQGVRLYTAGEAERLGNIRADVLTKIVAVAQRLSGISEGDAEELGKSLDGPEASAGSSSN